MSDKDSTRDRIIAAATAEFARYGIAGARVERIAKTARTSKERVYAHFRGKDELYRFVAARELTAMAEAVPLTPADLPDYAVRVHDHVVQHPERLRLMRWGELEQFGPEIDPDDPYRQVIDRKIEQLRLAQHTGVIDQTMEPMDVLVFVSQLALSWAGRAEAVPEGVQRERFLESRRRAIELVVERAFPRVAGTAARPGAE